MEVAEPNSGLPGGGPEHLDVLVVGAGLAGIGVGCHLQQRCSGKSYAILESRDKIGGTWDLFRYPGVRSDSDMHTLGYRFRPWTGDKSLADGPSILDYIRQTADDHGVTDKVRLHHRVVRAEWSAKGSFWAVEAERSDGGETVNLTCGFLFVCSGYYRYEEGYSPEFPGAERFEGQIVHPQHWPEDLDNTDKRIVVIGSGATAVTLVPALAEQAAHVTMLQRSPSYVLALPGRDPIARILRRVLSDRLVYALIRWKNVLVQAIVFRLGRRWPGLAKWLIRKGVERSLPAGYDVDTHFNPSYNPWDQRLCVAQDGDFFKAISDGRAGIVTDRIETFTERGIKLESGAELEADTIVTATGLNLLFMGGMELVVDGHRIDPGKSMSYKGMMLSGVPNFAYVVGYPNTAWTLKVDLTAEYVCRLLAHMDAEGYADCRPELTDSVAEATALDFAPNYVLRSLDKLPKQAAKVPWRLRMSYPLDLVDFRYGSIENGAMRFSRPMPAAQPIGKIPA